MVSYQKEKPPNEVTRTTFTGAKSVLGVRSLEDLGLKVDPVKGSLEATRPAGVAFYYRHLKA